MSVTPTVSDMDREEIARFMPPTPKPSGLSNLGEP